jgi:hypothetical protein
MSLEDLGNIGEFVAAVGVIISLVYLAVQIRQNTKSVRSNSNQQILQGIAELNQFLGSAAEVTDLFWRGTRDPESLSEDEWHRFVHIASALIRRMELMFLNHREGFVPAQMWEPQVKNLQRWFSTPGIQRWFAELGVGVDADFRRYVQELKP